MTYQVQQNFFKLYFNALDARLALLQCNMSKKKKWEN